MDERARLMALAGEYLESAASNLDAERFHVAFESARHAAELAGKAPLLDARGDYPKSHDVGRPLAAAGLVPPGISPAALDRFLAQYLRGRYGGDVVDASSAREALRMARVVVAHAKERAP